MFVVGEQGRADGAQADGIALPDLTGIFLGNNALDAIYADTFAFYWKRNTTTQSLGKKEFKLLTVLMGHSSTPGAGDPGKYPRTDVFLCPTTVGKTRGFLPCVQPCKQR